MQHASTLVRQARTGPLSYMVREVAAPGQPALPSMFSKKHGPLDAEANRKQVLRMYRKIVRSVPRILLAYEITGGPVVERHVVSNLRHHFERNKAVTDMGVAAVLRHKAEMEVTESLLMWKTKSHVCNLILNESAPPIAQLMAKQQQEKQLPAKQKESAFLTSFYQG